VKTKEVYTWYIAWVPHSTGHPTSSDGGPYKHYKNAEAVMNGARERIEAARGIIKATEVQKHIAPIDQLVVEGIEGVLLPIR